MCLCFHTVLWLQWCRQKTMLKRAKTKFLSICQNLCFSLLNRAWPWRMSNHVVKLSIFHLNSGFLLLSTNIMCTLSAKKMSNCHQIRKFRRHLLTINSNCWLTCLLIGWVQKLFSYKLHLYNNTAQYLVAWGRPMPP